MKLHRMLTLFLKRITSFLSKNQNISILRQVGIFLYKFGLIIAVQMYKKMPEIESIYTKTKFDKWFKVGQSDIDIQIIIKDMSIEQEWDFLKRFWKIQKSVEKLFPFIELVILAFNRDFKIHQIIGHTKISRKGEHFQNWKLIYGKENRMKFKDNETKLSYPYTAFSYRDSLFNIYEFKLNENQNLRVFYKCIGAIIRNFFRDENKREAKNIDEYKEFFKKRGLSERFTKEFFELPGKDFKSNQGFLALALFSIIKLIESLKTENLNKKTNKMDFKVIKNPHFKININSEIKNFVNKLDKKHIHSIYLEREVYRSQCLFYLIFKDGLSYKEFKQQFNLILDNLHLLKEVKDRVKLKEKVYTSDPQLFPIILTEKMIKNTEFIDDGDPYGSVNFNSYAKKLYGDKISITPNYKQIRKMVDMPKTQIPLQFFQLYKLQKENKSYSILLMIHKLLNEKNILCLHNIEKEYFKHYPKLDMDSVEERYKFVRKEMKKQDQDLVPSEDFNQ